MHDDCIFKVNAGPGGMRRLQEKFLQPLMGFEPVSLNPVLYYWTFLTCNYLGKRTALVKVFKSILQITNHEKEQPLVAYNFST